MVVWIPTLWIATGVCLFASIHFLTTGPSRDGARLFTAFGTLCLVVAVYLGLSASMQTPAIHLPWAAVEQAHMAIACVIYPVGVWFIALYSRLRRWHGWVWAASVVFGACLIANLVQPSGLLVAGFRLARPLTLPWGEQVNQFSGTPIPTAFAYVAATLLVFLWMLWRAAALARQGDRRRTFALGGYVCLQAAVTLYAEYESLHRLGGVEASGLPFLVLVLMVSQSLNHELRMRAALLDASNASLRAENLRRTRLEARLRTMAYTDAISGLPNRYALNEWLGARLAAQPQRQGALAILDLRRFAIVNHVFGHRTGDLLIREAGQRLVRAVGGDGCVARLHGDEFAVVIPLPDDSGSPAQAHAIHCARRLRDAIAMPSLVALHAPPAAARIGVAMLHAEASPATLLRRAYAALHLAKAAGHNEPVLFLPSMEADTDRQVHLESDLQTAITTGQLSLAYQPQVDAAGKLIGAEALLRWQHPRYGAVGPAEFVPIAERSGQMPRLGQFVLREACTALAGFAHHGRLQLAVNVSPRQLFLADFLDGVQAAIREAAVDPHALTLEVTETAFIHDLTDAAAKISALNALGIRVSVDDFGTGYASITSLKAFAVSELKIDQSFVRDMSTTRPDRLIAAMIAMGRALDLNVVAEGVERDDQLVALRELGCDTFQGFLIARPMSADGLVRWMQRADTSDSAA